MRTGIAGPVVSKKILVKSVVVVSFPEARVRERDFAQSLPVKTGYRRRGLPTV